MWKPKRTILVINGKGGCGKTTISTNLAGYFASQGLMTTMMDYDPQGSSLAWHKQRPENVGDIHFIPAAERFSATATRSWRLRIPLNTERLIVDVPAGMDGYQLQDMIRRVDTILIPVTPSPIDIHATSDFIRDLFLIGKVRSYPVRIGVIANRVKQGSPAYTPLQRFLSHLDIPFITSLWDSHNYLIASERGLSIHELPPHETEKDVLQWRPLIDWLNSDAENAHNDLNSQSHSSQQQW